MVFGLVIAIGVIAQLPGYRVYEGIRLGYVR